MKNTICADGIVYYSGGTMCNGVNFDIVVSPINSATLTKFIIYQPLRWFSQSNTRNSKPTTLSNILYSGVPENRVAREKKNMVVVNTNDFRKPGYFCVKSIIYVFLIIPLYLLFVIINHYLWSIS